MVGWVTANTVGASAGKPTQAKDSEARHATVWLSMYAELPEGEICIEEFEQAALDRLRVLKGLEELKAKGFRPDQLQERVLSLVDTYLKAPTREATLRKDVISHYVLRLAYCRTEELRRWFLAQECDLFRARFRSLLPGEQKAFVTRHRLGFSPLTRVEFEDVAEQLRATLLSVMGSQQAVNAALAGPAPHENFYRVPFQVVPDLVGGRKVYLKDGFALVSREQTASLVVQPFRIQLSKALVLTARRWSQIVAPAEADRLAPIVESLSRRYLGPDYSDPEKRGVAGAITAADVPRLDSESFPLCMHVMYQALQTTHHLKHDGRMQLGLFLKGIGLPLEEAIRFWRMEMAPIAPGDKFDKEYLYNVRHNYGKEGNRRDYTPYTCAKVISTIPGTGQVHGCPFRTFGSESLESALSTLQVAPAKAREAVQKAKAGHYQLACAAVWEGKHGCACETGVNHPNQYFEESRKALAAPEQDFQTPARPGMARGQGTPSAREEYDAVGFTSQSGGPHAKFLRTK